MKNSKKNFNSAGQSTTEVKRSQKHDANLQKNSTLYFQIGLILCLLGTYSLFEMQFQEKKIKLIDEKVTAEKVVVDYVPPFIEEVIEPQKSKPLPSKEITDILKVVENDTKIIETVVKNTDDKKTNDFPELNPDDIVVVNVPDPVDVPFALIEKVPVYPGCERKKTNEEKRKCMSKKLTKLVSKKFDTSIASEYGITGLQKIQTQFTVDKNGNVTDVKVRSNHPALDKEARRIINKIPHMKPGYQRDIPVGVIYTLPITFEARN